MRLPDSAYHLHPWRIHEIAPDFQLEDVWALPATGSSTDFATLVSGICASDPSQSPIGVTRALWALRWTLGSLLDWDGAENGIGTRVPTLRERLPSDLLAAARPRFVALPLNPLYLTANEFAAEIADRTVHGVMHIGWVEDGGGQFHGQLAVLVKPNGTLGTTYLAAVRPFRHLIIYPTMMRQLERRWQARPGGSPTGAETAAD